MNPFDQQMMILLYSRTMMNARQEMRYSEPAFALQVKNWQLKRKARFVMRKAGILLMRIGGKLVYLGTAPYEPEA